MRDFAALVEQRYADLYENTAAHVGRSIISGSHITGAPGQPFKDGDLIKSWRRYAAGRWGIRWVSTSPYAHVIEYNLRGATLRSKVGGFHSVTLTRLMWPRIVQYELNKLRNSRPRDRRGRFIRAEP
jgi:hypothetical protein